MRAVDAVAAGAGGFLLRLDGAEHAGENLAVVRPSALAVGDDAEGLALRHQRAGGAEVDLQPGLDHGRLGPLFGQHAVECGLVDGGDAEGDQLDARAGHGGGDLGGVDAEHARGVRAGEVGGGLVPRGLPEPDADRQNYFALGPESSRRARSLAVWATLRAYGRSGYREIVERHIDLAASLARRVDEAPDLERLAETPLNVVCFRARPEGIADDAALNALNARIAEAIVDDGRVLFGSTTYEGRTAFRPAIVNWRTSERDIDLLVEVTRELLEREVSTSSAR